MKIVFRIINFFLIIFAIIFTLIAAQKHQGNMIYYLIFSIFVNYFFIYSLNTKRLFFETYFATFIWLGFWFKYTFSLVFLNGIIYDSGPQTNIENIDKALITSIIGISAVFLSYIIRQLFFSFKISQLTEKSFFENLYIKNKNIVIFLFIITFLSIGIFNFNLSVYQKGFIYEHNVHFLIVNFIKWMLLFGLTTFSCFLIYTEIIREKKISTFTALIVFFEIFISYSSMLSRSVILNLSAITYSFTKYLSFIKNKLKFFVGFLILIIIMFLLNNYFSNYFRINYAIEVGKYEEAKKEYEERTKNNISEKKNDTFTYELPFKVSNDPGIKPDPVNMSVFVVINRWSGIDSMLAVVNSKKLSFDLFFESLKEKKIISEKTFYETTFKIDLDGGKEIRFGDKRILKGNTLPGIFSFIFYTGNYLFFFISILLLTLIFSCFEILSLKLSNNNMIYASFISFLIAFRLSNFGYAPMDSYLYIISILLSMILIFFLSNYKESFLNLK